MKIIFSHGKESGPWGRKIKAMADIARAQNYDVESIDYSDTLDPEVRVRRLIEKLTQEGSDVVLVGSSMGGYVSAVAAHHFDVKGLFLLAPALYMPKYAQHDYPTNCTNIEVVHGWNDTVIPYQHSLRFAQHTKCSLHLIDGDHSLNSSLSEVTAIFEAFLRKVNKFL